MRRASDWATRVMHEASSYEENCFVTLTYGRDRLPPGASLDHRDFQLFLKRLRADQAKTRRIRFYMCGEYGDVNERPHYHACLFNIDFRSDRIMSGKSGSGMPFYESAQLTRLWGHGIASVQDLTRETAGYCARYVMKKILGPEAKQAYDLVDPETGEITHRKPPYAAMSLKPGIGAAWFEKYGDQVGRQDFVVASGAKAPPPKYYDKLLKRRDQAQLESNQFARQHRAKAHADDNTDERRRVREIVHEARVSSLKRSLDQ